MLSMKYSILLLLCIVAKTVHVQSSKTKTLAMCSMMPLNASGFVTLPACYAAMQVVIDDVNSRDDILPDYRLRFDIENEGSGALLASRSLIGYLRKFESEAGNNTFLSPIVLGPTVACQSVAHTVKLLKLTEFTTQCNGPYLVARKNLYSSMYRFLLPSDYVMLTGTLVYLHVGKWRQMGIVSNYLNANEVLEDARRMHFANSSGHIL